jgi:hypothetical protein
MNKFYKIVDPNGQLKFTSLFSTKDQIYSGSENNEFYLAKLYAIVKILKHQFPIIIDSFREGELATEKETIVLREFLTLQNQIILTTTLKEQERNKYNNMNHINAINYDSNISSHILNKQSLSEFGSLLSGLAISL